MFSEIFIISFFLLFYRLLLCPLLFIFCYFLLLFIFCLPIHHTYNPAYHMYPVKS